MTSLFTITATQHQQTTMACGSPRLILAVVMISVAVRPSETVSANLGAPDTNNLNMEFSPDDSVAGGLDTSLDNSNATPLIISTPPMTTTRARPRPHNTTTTTTTTTTVRPRTTQFRLTQRQIKTDMIPKTTTVSSTTTTTSRRKPSDSKTPSPAKPQPLRLDPAISVHDSGHSPFNEPGHYHSSGSGPPQNSWPHGSQDSLYPPGDQPQGQQTQGQSTRGRHNFPWWWLLMEEV